MPRSEGGRVVQENGWRGRFVAAIVGATIAIGGFNVTSVIQNRELMLANKKDIEYNAVSIARLENSLNQLTIVIKQMNEILVEIRIEIRKSRPTDNSIIGGE